MRFAFVLLLLIACAPSRPSADAPTLLARRAEFFEDIQEDAAAAARVLEERILLHARSKPGEHIDVLILSGGGAKGAFGAGFLQGWDHPNFDVVTGVSTGALIAPFAFIGTDEMLEEVVNLYRRPKNDWVISRTFSALFRGTSFFDVSGLHRDIRARINSELVDDIAARHRDGGLLLIGTTDLDLGLVRVWNATRLADAGELRRLQDVLLASAAIPGVFPPVEIEDQLYVDGGVAAQFVGIDPAWIYTIFHRWRQREPELVMPGIRFWIIVNNKTSVTPTTIQPAWTAVAARSIDVLIRQAIETMLSSYINGAARVERDLGVKCEVRYVTIPDAHPEPEGKQFFDPKVMDSLIKLGRRMGADPKVWQSTIDDPDWPRPRATPLRATSDRAEDALPR